jgi:hypothetical protein
MPFLGTSATKAIQVRRSSDNTTLDIGFVGSNLNVAALLAFVGAGNGFVTTWYDQVGSVNATQATALSQPRIVNGGTIVVDSGMPAIEFLGTQDFSFTFSHSGTLSLGCVGRKNTNFRHISNWQYNNLEKWRYWDIINRNIK